MDPSQTRGRSPSATGHQQHQQHIRNSHSPSPADSSNIGLGIETDGQSFNGDPNFSTYNTGADFLDPQQAQAFPVDPSFQAFDAQLQGANDLASFGQPQDPLAADFGNDFTIFPPTSGEQFNAPLFAGDPGLPPTLGSPDLNNMAQVPSQQPTPPHMLKQESMPHHSPSFNQTQFVPSPGHSRHVSLGPEAALLPGQDWNQFRSHRRSPSEYSDVSSVGIPSPNLGINDSFDHDPSHSPMQRPQDHTVIQELHGIGSFSISDRGRSPSHSPAISPRIPPQQVPDMNQQFALASNGYASGPPQTYAPQAEAFPSFPQQPTDMGQGYPMAAPTINIDYAPPPVRNNEGRSLDTDALTPPDRGEYLFLVPGTDALANTMIGRRRQRAVTDPYNSGSLGPRSPGALSPHLGAELSPNRPDSPRSLSPLERQSVSPNRRRQSTSAVPNNVLALRLAEPEQGGEPAGPKRVQKHPATFQCSLCPKRFTRAYNLRSHLRTHTDERPFVCTVCGKAFARQHDRKRHEGLHSGEKKFVCKGDLKTAGQWGCGRRFARADALGRHFRSEAGRICIKPLLDEEMMERQRQWGEQRMAQQAAAQQQQMAMGGLMPQPMDPGYPPQGGYMLPQALLAQYPALANMDWGAPNMQGEGSGIEDDLSGRSSFDASEYDAEDDGGYVSGPGTGFGPGGMGEGYGEMGYASDYGSGPRRA